jgi:Flp pilus assembly protein TadG
MVRPRVAHGTATAEDHGHRRRRSGQRWVIDERGAALVEFVIIMPALLIILFGTMEVSRLWLTISVVAEAAREAARMAALKTPFVANDSTAVAKATSILSSANLTATSTAISCAPNPACPGGLGSAAGTVSATVTVNFSTPVPLLASLLGGNDGLTVSQTAQMRYEP